MGSLLLCDDKSDSGFHTRHEKSVEIWQGQVLEMSVTCKEFRSKMDNGGHRQEKSELSIVAWG